MRSFNHEVVYTEQPVPVGTMFQQPIPVGTMFQIKLLEVGGD